ncbi:hypothetical protein EDB83DRAFT_1781627 [Lactarius deliciosus]|nr:hypothetical protein EDB83DRAFT_1781627 [Lactarius deliciosus]
MVAARNRKMFSNSLGPSASQNTRVPVLVQGRSLDSPPDAEPQGDPSQLRVEVTVLRAHNVPNLKNIFGLKVFVTVASQATEKKTPSVSVKGRTARWGESLGAFILQPSTPLVLRLYAKRFACRDILIGTHEMIPVESQTDTPFVFTNNGDKQAGQSVQLVKLYLTVALSPNTISYPISPIIALDLQPTKIIDSPSGEAEKPSLPQDPTNPTCSTIATGSETLSPAESALHGASEALGTINLSNTWEDALERIKWVMDTVSQVAELYPYAKMAHSLLFAIPKTLLEQFQLDGNIRTLLAAMHDSFDFANQEDRFKAIGRDSKQAQILTLMLQHICNCCDFIRSYAKDPRFWKRLLKNIGGQVNKQIEDFRTTLLELHKALLDEAIITTEITALQILDDIGIISSRLDGMDMQLKTG